MDDEWIKVKNRRPRKLFPIKHYWIGFDFLSRERWFLELNNGQVLTPLNQEYYDYCSKPRLKFAN